jgi:hypothetical protein
VAGCSGLRVHLSSLARPRPRPQVFFSLCGPRKQARKAEALFFLCVVRLPRKPTRRDINYSTTVCQHEEPSPYVVFSKSDAERSSPLQRVFSTRVARQGTIGFIGPAALINCLQLSKPPANDRRQWRYFISTFPFVVWSSQNSSAENIGVCPASLWSPAACLETTWREIRMLP